MNRVEYLHSLNALLLDAAQTICGLDAVELLDGWANVAQEIATGRTEYRNLIARHAALELSPSDSAAVQVMTDAVLARVRFLENHLHPVHADSA